MEAGLLLAGDCNGLLGGSLVETGLVLAEVSLWVGLVEAEGVTLRAFVVSDASAEVLGGDEVEPLLGVVLC